MKSIEVIWTNEITGTSKPERLATNDSGEGLFSRDPAENGYRQLAGNGQTPALSTPAKLMKFAKSHFHEPGVQTIRKIRGSDRGWV